ncbi:hypothetical protein [Paenibacillus sp. XY044]|uniref:hypothetical protein n=1 Tax=Paenibacillus sp. XY044 TaxID=2026089 RepID=UPI000B98C5AC|nr:hypothetical protein [Paenibacillus sp. XY044]OZB94105.1 hypothetical protein CJP46_17975 [Paenibacillus sp. XY044]
MRVRILLVIVLILSVIGLSCWILFVHNENQYTSQITIKQIPGVLRTIDLPDMPQEWELESIKKYDDGFISPIVIVSYKNGVTVRLTSSASFTFTHEFVKQKPPQRWKQRVDYYRSDDSIAYVFTLNRLTYAFSAPIHLQAEIDKMMNNMLKLG